MSALREQIQRRIAGAFDEGVKSAGLSERQRAERRQKEVDYALVPLMAHAEDMARKAVEAVATGERLL